MCWKTNNGDANQKARLTRVGKDDEATTSRDNTLEQLKGSVGEYDRSFEPIGVEDWATLDPNPLDAEPGDVTAEHLKWHKNATMSAAVMRTMPNIAREWGLQDAEMAILSVLKSTHIMRTGTIRHKQR